MKRSFIFILVALFMLACLPVLAASPSQLLKQADQAYGKHLYKEALALYMQVRQNLKGPDEQVQRVDLQILKTYDKLKDYDRFIEELDRFAKSPDTLLKARAWHLGAHVYQHMPHYGFKRDGKIYRDTEHREGEEVYLYSEDRQRAEKLYYEARQLYEGLAGGKLLKQPDFDQELIAFNTDLFHFLNQTHYPSFEAKEKLALDWKTKGVGRLDAKTKVTEQMYFLYQEIARLAERSQLSHESVKAEYLWARFLLQRIGQQAESYPERDPLEILSKAVARYPKDPLAPELQLVRAHLLQARQQYTAALEQYQVLIKQWPASPLVGDARHAIQRIQWPELGLSVPGIQATGRQPAFQVRGRNVPELRFQVHRIDLPAVLLADKTLRDPAYAFANFPAYFGSKVSQARRFYQQKQAEWTWKPQPQPYHHFSQDIELPAGLPAGAYLIEAVGKDVEGVALLVVSDIALTEQRDRDESLLFVTNADTGHPVANAKVHIREHYERNQTKVRVFEGQTDAKGLLAYKTYDDSDYSRLEVFVQQEDHYTLSGLQYWSRYDSAERSYRVYSYTDRPVYRPGQTVYFNHMVRLYDNGKYANVPRETVTVSVNNPKGEEIYKKNLMTDAYGLVHGQLQLPEEPPLGVYNIFVRLPDQSLTVRESSGRSFRVEEYKRPEFEVTVKPQGTAPRPGEAATMRIQARYYFGAPVTEGKVKYTLYKKPFYMYYQGKPSPYQWLYGSYDEELYRYPYQGSGQVVRQEEVALGPEGFVDIAFATDKTATDMEYEIQAEVTDASRRMIQGEGDLAVTNQSFYAFMELDRGFYAPWEHMDVEVNLVTLERQPVLHQAGTLEVFRLKGEKELKPEAQPFMTQAVASNEQGRVFYRWKPQEEGKFLLVYSSRDAYERPVRTEREVWVVGKNFQGRHYKFDKVELLTDRKLYKEGEKARVMINSQFDDSYVLLFEEAGHEMLGHQLLHLAGRSRVIDIPIVKRHLPNFFLRALMVHDRTLFEDTQELFVPPAHQFLQIDIQTDKQEFKPGEKAKVQLQVRDSQGKPVQTALSLGVTDASIYYIQPDISGDLRTYYFGDRRSRNLSAVTSFDTSFSAIHQIHKPWAEYKLHFKGADLERRFRNGDGESSGGEALDEMSDASPAEAETTSTINEKPAPAPKADLQDKKEADGLTSNLALQKQAAAPPQIRKNFAETAFWQPVIVTDAQGRAKAELTFPDSLTTWRLQAKGITLATQVGHATGHVRTNKKLLLRMQAPRFFTERDEVVLSANVRNQFDKPQQVKAQLEVPPALMQILGPAAVDIQVPAQGEKRVDWRVKVKQEGQARLLMKALAAGESDAVQMDLPVHVHGVDKAVTKNGALDKENSGTETLELPAERQIGSGRLKIVLNPSLAGTLLEALPYLAEYPYGCVEQTTSRFVPAVLTAHTLQKLGLDLKALGQQQNLDPKQLSLRVKNPIWDKAELDAMVKEGLKRLYNFQNPDGGWGWWSGSASDPYMSAYVLYALQLARQTDYAIDGAVISRGLGFLKGAFKEAGNAYLQAYLGFVLSLDRQIEPQQLEGLFKGRDDLNHYAKALLALSYHYLGQGDKAKLILQNLKSFVKIDEANGTASWKGDEGYWWYWYGDRTETNAFILKAFVQILPQDPVAPMLVKWLVNNRQGNRWYSTKDTAQVLYAMNDYLLQTQELSPDYTLKVLVNSKLVRQVKVNRQNALTFDNALWLTDAELKAGPNSIRIEKEGSGRLYYGLQLSYFTKEENIKGAGHEIAVKREYFRYSEIFNPQTQIVDKRMTPLQSGDVLKSGEEVEVKLTIKSSNDYEYLIFEDPKPAGYEALDLKSGYLYQNGVGVNRELRDEKVVFFLDHLRQGSQVLTYRLRAEIPGTFHALPHQAEAMYAPQIRAISDEAILGVED